MDNKKTVLISAGGTGGHMSPAAALANTLIEKGVIVELVTDTRGQKYTGMFPDIPVHVVKSGTAHSGIIGKVRGALNLALGILQGFSLVRRAKPDIVVGFGGYPSVPAVFAAQMLGIPTGLHEQNAVLGKANVFLAPKAKFVALSLPLPSSPDVKEQIKQKIVVTGNPVRAEIIALKDTPYPSIDGKINIFIMGGSLGASVFSDVIPKAVAELSDENKSRLSIVQQCRKSDIDEAKSLYDKGGVSDVRLATFYDDVAAEISKAHLFIGRSGASTVAEISIAGRPAIYVPYPHHKDQQQKKNAMKVANNGGAWIIDEQDFTVGAVKSRIEEFLDNSDILIEASARAKDCGLPYAAEELAELTIKNMK